MASTGAIPQFRRGVVGGGSLRLLVFTGVVISRMATSAIGRQGRCRIRDRLRIAAVAHDAGYRWAVFTRKIRRAMGELHDRHPRRRGVATIAFRRRNEMAGRLTDNRTVVMARTADSQHLGVINRHRRRKTRCGMARFTAVSAGDMRRRLWGCGS